MDYLYNAEHCRPNSNLEFLVFDIDNATKRLNLSNTLDCDLLNVRHILYAHPSIYLLLKLLYHNMLLGIVPERFGHSVITLVIKSYNKPFDDSSNYNAINIVPIVAKVFESVLVYYIDKYVTPHKNQFGFVKNGGCNKAVFSFYSTVKYLEINIVMRIFVHLMQLKHLIELTIFICYLVYVIMDFLLI